MGFFVTIPAILGIICAARVLGTGGEWETWFVTLFLSSIGIALLWPVLHWMWQRMIGQWLSYAVLLATPGSIIFAVIRIVQYSHAGGHVLSAVISLVGWIVLGILSGMVLGRFLTWRYGFLA